MRGFWFCLLFLMTALFMKIELGIKIVCPSLVSKTVVLILIFTTFPSKFWTFISSPTLNVLSA
jgi:hypothetical protein